MSKDWEVINIEYAAKLLRKIANIYLEKIRDLEDECSHKLNSVASDYEHDNFYNKDEIIMLGKCWNLSNILDSCYEGIQISDKMRETASRLLDKAVSALKAEISRKAIEEIIARTGGE